jgi:hypothetical protein
LVIKDYLPIESYRFLRLYIENILPKEIPRFPRLIIENNLPQRFIPSCALLCATFKKKFKMESQVFSVIGRMGM